MPGGADLTAHVRFRALAEAARPARAHGPVRQGTFLGRLGIAARAQALARGRGDAAEAAAVAAAHRRLTHPGEMGHVFRALALTPEDAPVPPGFDANDARNSHLGLARPATRHGFFTRRGGASSGIFTGLNCGPGRATSARRLR